MALYNPRAAIKVVLSLGSLTVLSRDIIKTTFNIPGKPTNKRGFTEVHTQLTILVILPLNNSVEAGLPAIINTQ